MYYYRSLIQHTALIVILGTSTLYGLSPYSFSPIFKQADDALVYYKRYCERGDNEQWIIKALEEVNKIKKKICFYHRLAAWYYQIKSIQQLSNDSFLCAYILRKAAFNKVLFNKDLRNPLPDDQLTLQNIHSKLLAMTSPRAVQKGYNQALLYKTYELIEQTTVLKLLTKHPIANATQTALALSAARNAIPETTKYLIRNYPVSMQHQYILDLALDTLADLPRDFLKSNPNKVGKIETHIEHLLNHLKNNYLIHHTSLHRQLRRHKPSLNIVQMLLQRSYDPNVQDHEGKTAVDVIYQKANDVQGTHTILSRNDIKAVESMQNHARFSNKDVARDTIAAVLAHSLRSKKEKSIAKTLGKYIGALGVLDSPRSTRFTNKTSTNIQYNI